MFASGEIDDPVQGALNTFDASARDVLREQLLRAANFCCLARAEQALLFHCQLEECLPGRIPNGSWHQVKLNQERAGSKFSAMRDELMVDLFLTLQEKDQLEVDLFGVYSKKDQLLVNLSHLLSGKNQLLVDLFPPNAQRFNELSSYYITAFWEASLRNLLRRHSGDT